jgi:hydrogenase-4 component F
MIIVMILLTMIIWAFGKNIFNLMFTQPIDFDDSDVEKINPAESLSQFILLGLVIYLGINPPAQFISLIQEAVQSLPH